MKRLFVFACCLLTLTVLTGCQASHTVIDWVDFLQYKGATYQSTSGEISDPSFIGDKIGMIKQKLDGNIQDPDYRSKDGDASFLDPGTNLYAVINHPHLIAVKDSTTINGYRLYSREELDHSDINTFSDKYVSKVEIFEEEADQQYLFNRAITKQNEIQKFIKLLQAGQRNPVEANENDRTYAIIIYSASPIASKFYINYNEKQYFWFNQDCEVLPEELQNYLSPTTENNHPKDKYL